MGGADRVATTAGSASVHVVSSCGPWHVVGVFGALDRTGLRDLHEQCLPRRLPPSRTVVLDFRAMTACPSALFVALLAIRDRLSAASVPLEVVGLDDAVEAIVTGRAGP